mmetsp:Transcript_8395/g.23087  ORF Transcript_8395/g.23087 Transcript_8395/m.23087 type:complete len:208 (-) Transcript_8395:1727-2350(-)
MVAVAQVEVDSEEEWLSRIGVERQCLLHALLRCREVIPCKVGSGCVGGEGAACSCGEERGLRGRPREGGDAGQVLSRRTGLFVQGCPGEEVGHARRGELLQRLVHSPERDEGLCNVAHGSCAQHGRGGREGGANFLVRGRGAARSRLARCAALDEAPQGAEGAQGVSELEAHPRQVEAGEVLQGGCLCLLRIATSVHAGPGCCLQSW